MELLCKSILKKQNIKINKHNISIEEKNDWDFVVTILLSELIFFRDNIIKVTTQIYAFFVSV